MRIPNAENAVIAPAKRKDYLLNSAHKRGAAKARLLLSLGYSVERWQTLEADLRAQHLSAEVAAELESDYGKSYAIVATIKTPSGRTIPFRRSISARTGRD